MNNYLKFLFLSLLLFLPIGMEAEDRDVVRWDASQIQPIDNERSQKAPFGKVALFSIDTRAETEANNSSTSLDRNNTSDDNDEPAHRETSLKNYTSSCLFLRRSIESGFTEIDLIFPFHFFF